MNLLFNDRLLLRIHGNLGVVSHANAGSGLLLPSPNIAVRRRLPTCCKEVSSGFVQASFSRYDCKGPGKAGLNGRVGLGQPDMSASVPNVWNAQCLN